MTPIVITPVKNSLDTVKRTLEAISGSDMQVDYFVFNDFSDAQTEEYLQKHQQQWGYTLINLEDHVNTPSPNYRTVLIMAQQMAQDRQTDLIIVESDVIVERDTFSQMVKHHQSHLNSGMVAAITVDEVGDINFPYNHIGQRDPGVIKTNRSLSFCCTLLGHKLLKAFDFNELREDKDWYDVHISKKSRSLGFENYLLKQLPVRHLPHSSRPWKMEKYSNPLKYYFKKFFLKRDRI
ncbi:MAG: glycosyltransferase family 2 protein [Cyclobacteriaceae bacterium]|nr:glycosyltransferase family 2 protein [Cyclobacteriaceae bacterium]